MVTSLDILLPTLLGNTALQSKRGCVTRRGAWSSSGSLFATKSVDHRGVRPSPGADAGRGHRRLEEPRRNSLHDEWAGRWTSSQTQAAAKPICSPSAGHGSAETGPAQRHLLALQSVAFIPEDQANLPLRRLNAVRCVYAVAGQVEAHVAPDRAWSRVRRISAPHQ